LVGAWAARDWGCDWGCDWGRDWGCDWGRDWGFGAGFKVDLGDVFFFIGEECGGAISPANIVYPADMRKGV